MTNQPHRIITVGSRNWHDKSIIWEALTEAWSDISEDREIVVAHCDSTYVDDQARIWARWHHAKAEPHPAEGFGPEPDASHRRDAHLVSLGADQCLVFISPCVETDCAQPQPHGSHGATRLAALAEAAGIPVRKWTA
ncbi:SLOG family protein [Streptomyces sp. NPDC127051]|uniref:SLOG family protein n=1 Tax=Streptomyces sp. NPDC127051 TaxID=3347119 RepID=UPI00365C8E11